MTQQARGILAIWHDISPPSVEDTLAWYDFEHHAERVGVPGFLSARRYAAIDSTPEYFIRYETESIEVLSSKNYLERLNHPTAWTERALPTIINNYRCVCRVAFRHGRSEGGYIGTLLYHPEQSDWSDATAEVLREELENLVDRQSILSAEVWTTDPDLSSASTKERGLKGEVDRLLQAAVILHGSDVAMVRRAHAKLVDATGNRVKRAGFGLYAYAFGLDKRS